MRIVHLASGLGPTGTARSLSLLAPALAARGEEQVVLNLGADRPFAADLAAGGIAVRPVRFRNVMDPTGVRELCRGVAAFQPDVVHAWGNRAAALANWLRLPGRRRPPVVPLVVSDVRPAVGLGGRFARRAERFARVVRPAPLLVGPPPTAAFDPAAHGLPASARFVASVSNFGPHTDPIATITAFDILKHTLPDVHLLSVGDGPGRDKAERMNRAVAFEDDRVHFLGIRNDVPAVLAAASVVLVSHHEGGRTVAAEAVAAGRPVVAFDTPDMAGVVRDGETGILVPVGDGPMLAKGLYRVLTDPALAAKRTTSPASLAAVTSPAAAAREWQAIYRTAAG